jgi:hypothetical protein
MPRPQSARSFNAAGVDFMISGVEIEYDRVTDTVRRLDGGT